MLQGVRIGFPGSFVIIDGKKDYNSLSQEVHLHEVFQIIYSHYDTDQKTVIEKEITKYKYNNKGQLIKEYETGFPGCTEWTYDGNNVTETNYEDRPNNVLGFVTYETYEHGNLIKDVQYGGKDGTGAGESADYKLSTGWHSYKKFKLNSKYRKLVSKQQACLEFITF